MANILEVYQGVTSTLVPTTSWAAPNGLFGATADRNDGTVYSWVDSTSTITLPSSNLADGYLILWGYETEDSSNGRYNPQGRMIQASGTGNFATATTGGYSRDNSENHAYVSGWSFIDNPSASATLQFQWRRDSDGPNTSDGTVRSFIQVIPFYYADIGIYSSTTSSLYGGTTPNLMTGFTADLEGTNITISSNQISVTGDNKRYLCLGSGWQDGYGNTRTQRWYGLEIDGSFDHSAKGCMYLRNTGNEQGGTSFLKLLETATATRTIEMNCYLGDGILAGQGGADANGTGPSSGAHAMVVIELNDSAEVFSSVDSVGGQEFALAGPVDVDIASTGDIEFSDAASFTRVTDIAVNCESAMDVFAFSNVSHARESAGITSGLRWTVHGEFTINGVEQTAVGFHGNYNRGAQGGSDAFGSSCNNVGIFAVSADQDIGVSNQELTGTEGGAGDIESQPGWVGFGLINLDTLEGGGTDSLGSGTSSLDFTSASAARGRGQLAGASPLAFTSTSAMRGVGRLLGPSTLDFAAASGIVGKGNLTGGSTLDFTATAILKGKSRLLGPSTLDFTLSSALGATGRLIGPSTLDFAVAGTIVAAGGGVNQIAGSSSLGFSAASILKGTGLLAGGASLDFAASGDISGGSGLAGSSSLGFTIAGTLRGRSTLVGGTTLDFSVLGSVVGKSSLGGGSGLDFSSTGILRRRPRVWINTVASKNGSEVELPWTSWTATSITFDDTVGPPTGAVYIGIETPELALAWSSLQQVNVGGTNQIVGSTTLDFTSIATLIGTGRLAGISSLDFAASSILKGNSSLEGSTSLGFAAAASLRGRGRAVASSALDFSSTSLARGYGRLDGSSTFDWSIFGALSGFGQLSGSVSFDFAASGTIRDISNNAISGTTSLTFTVGASIRGVALSAGVTSLGFATAGIIHGNYPLSGGGNLDFTADAALAGRSSLVGPSSLDFTSSSTVRGIGRLISPSTLDFVVSSTARGLGRMVGSSNFNFVATANLPVSASAFSGRHIGPFMLEFFD